MQLYSYLIVPNLCLFSMECLPMIRKNDLQSFYIYHFSLKFIRLIILTNFNSYKFNRIGGEKSYINKITPGFSDTNK